MLEFHVSVTGVAVLVVVLILFLVGVLFFIYPASNKVTTIPGPNVSDEREGNLNDIEREGSLTQFLCACHKEYGEVVAFKYGQPLVVSVANPKYFPPRTQLFDIPGFLFESWRPMVGDGSFLFAKGIDGFRRRDIINFTLQPTSKADYAKTFYSLTSELTKKWKGLPEGQHIPLSQHMKGLATKAVCYMMFGDFFKDDSKVIKLHEAWNSCWSEIVATNKKEPTKSESDLEKAQQELRKLMKDAVESQWSSSSGRNTLITSLLAASNSDISAEEMIDDVITLFTVGMQVTNAVLTWSCYFVVTDEDVQKSLTQCLKRKPQDIITEIVRNTRAPSAVNDMVGSILKESIRCSEMFPFNGRVEDLDITIADHVVPKQTPIIEALAVTMKDEKLWKEPYRFNPKRFTDNERELPLNPLDFIPFAFAGSRRNPEDSLVYLLATVFIISIFHDFDVSLAGNDIKCDDPNYDGFVVMPTKEEIWVAVRTKGSEPEDIVS